MAIDTREYLRELDQQIGNLTALRDKLAKLIEVEDLLTVEQIDVISESLNTTIESKATDLAGIKQKAEDRKIPSEISEK